MKTYQEFRLGNVKLLSGKILNSAKLIYKTYGKLNKDRSNVVVLPTLYTGTHIRNEGFIGKNRALNPNRYFIISINMFGNGLSSSPSNATKNQKGSKFPKITLWDNIYCQYKLITEKLNIKRSEVPAITHVDYSARIQTVHKETNPKYYNLLSEFKKKTGCGVIVNTSFNVRGEPIVNTPEDAFNCFMGTELDTLVIGNFYLKKEKQNKSNKKNYTMKYELD